MNILKTTLGNDTGVLVHYIYQPYTPARLNANPDLCDAPIEEVLDIEAVYLGWHDVQEFLGEIDMDRICREIRDEAAPF